MIRRVGLATCALVLLAVTAVGAQTVVTGTVVRLDPSASVVVLDNGQMYRATPQTVFLVNNQPTNFAAIQPGMPIVVQSAQPVMYRGGQYVVVTQPAPVVAAPAPVVTAPVVPPVAGTYEVSGVVAYVGNSEPGRSSLTFQDGRHVWIDENTQIVANGGPVMLSTLRPGTFVVIRSTKPLAFRNNTYYTTPAAAAAAAPAAAAPVAVSPVSGTVVRIDQPNTIVLSDGRIVPATAQTVVMVDNRAVPFTTLQPGSRVVIYPNGQAGLVSGDGYALPAGAYPEIGTREKKLERNAP